MNLLTQKNIRAAIAYFTSVHHTQEWRECTPPFQERVAVAALEKVLGEKKKDEQGITINCKKSC